MKKIIFSFFAFLLSLNSFSQDSKDSKGIAPDFASFKGTLLVLENRDFRDNTLNRMTSRRMDKNYKGDYEMISEDDLSSGSYKDTKKFRFVVQLRNARTSTLGSSNSLDQSKFVMTDRLTNTQYETRIYSNWTHLMNQYIDLLEKSRFKE